MPVVASVLRLTVPLCGHCSLLLALRPRGLCTRCYNNPEVRDCYPTSRPANGERTGDNPSRVGKGRLPPRPVPYLPGTREKIAVMRDRASDGYQLFHPLDGLEARRALLN
jgi:hypothetical protein